MDDPTTRTFELLAVLQSGRPWPGGELAARLGVSARTLRRDVTRLRRLGYAVTSSRGTGGVYRLVAGPDGPPLQFTPEEAIATAAGLRHVASTEGDDADDGAARPATAALDKFVRTLPARTRVPVESVVASTSSAEHSADPDRWDPAVLGALASATRGRSHVRFRHVARNGRTTERRCEPYHLFLIDHRWYLLAWDLDRADWRRFRVDRITEVHVPGTTFTPREVPEEQDAFAVPAGSVLFHSPAPEVAPRLYARSGVLHAVDEARCRYVTGPDDWDWLASAVAAVGAAYVVEGPEDLIAATRRLATRATAATLTSA